MYRKRKIKRDQHNVKEKEICIEQWEEKKMGGSLEAGGVQNEVSPTLYKKKHRTSEGWKHRKKFENSWSIDN